MGVCARMQAEKETWEAIGWRVAAEMGDVLRSSSQDDGLLPPPVETFWDKLNQHLQLYLALLIILLAWVFLILVSVVLYIYQSAIWGVTMVRWLVGGASGGWNSESEVGQGC